MITIKNAVCPGCTLLCDDVTFHVDGHKLQSSIQCPEAQRWIEWANEQHTSGARGAVEVEVAIGAIAAHLKRSKMPLVAGLGQLTTQGQQVAWKIADASAAAVDVSLGQQRQASLYALQRQGKVSASLGEVANRGDLLVCWFCDPAATHPRLLDRLKAAGKTVVVIDSTKTRTAEQADHFIALKENDALEFLGHARGLLREERSASTDGAGGRMEGLDGIRLSSRQLIDRVVNSAYGCFIYGHVYSSTDDDPITLGHQKLVRQLNDHTRMVSIGLRDDGNSQSGENVLAAFSGYPRAVSLTKRIPEYCGNVWSAGRLLEERKCDFLLLFAGRAFEKDLAALGPAADAWFGSIPKGIIHYGALPEHLSSADTLQIAIPGDSAEGDFCRLDDVLLPLNLLRQSELPTDLQVLERLYDAIVACQPTA